MAFTLDRNEAASRLGVSTRTIDRHIQAERIRTRRIGKKMFLEEADVEKLRQEDPARREDDYEVITNPESKERKDDEILHVVSSKNTQSLELSRDAKMAIAEFTRIYSDAQGIIAKKDEAIKDLSYRVGKLETELKNSVNASDYHRTSTLLETAKSKNEADSRVFGEKISHLEKEVKKKNSFIIAMIVLFVLTVIAATIFLVFSRS